MATRFDHLVIAVRDLDAAIERYQRLGFEVRPGGKHEGLGTHNALIRFGLDYVELISIYDPALAGDIRGLALTHFLARHEGGLLGYALATATIEQDAQRFSQSGLPADGPFVMKRQRPDGHLLTWRLLVPEGVAWRQPWPFLIQWDAPDKQRLAWEQPGVHANGVLGWRRVAIAVRNLSDAVDLYKHQLGLTYVRRIVSTRLSAVGAVFKLGDARIEVLTPDGKGFVHDVLDSAGEGPIEVSFAVKDVQASKLWLTEHGVALDPVSIGPGTLLIAAREALGARIILEQV